MACHRGGRDKPNFKDYIRNMCGLILEPGKGGGGYKLYPPFEILAPGGTKRETDWPIPLKNILIVNGLVKRKPKSD